MLTVLAIRTVNLPTGWKAQSEGNSITSSSAVKAGENDILPIQGFVYWKESILPAGYDDD
jgi:hypothetical protein